MQEQDIPATTPWGAPESRHQITNGIVRFKTQRHGGIWASAARMQEMPEVLAELPTWAGPGWYEEDLEWSIVTLAFPHFFTCEMVACAIALAREWLSDHIDVDAYLRSSRGKHSAGRAGPPPYKCTQNPMRAP